MKAVEQEVSTRGSNDIVPDNDAVAAQHSAAQQKYTGEATAMADKPPAETTSSGRAAESICIQRLGASPLFAGIFSHPDANLTVFAVSTVFFCLGTIVIWVINGTHEPYISQIPAAVCSGLSFLLTVLWWRIGPPFRQALIRHILLLLIAPLLIVIQSSPCFLGEARVPFQNRFVYLLASTLWEVFLQLMIVTVEDEDEPQVNALAVLWGLAYTSADRSMRVVNNITDLAFANILFRDVRSPTTRNLPGPAQPTARASDTAASSICGPVGTLRRCAYRPPASAAPGL
jgi:hypothetical protein